MYFLRKAALLVTILLVSFPWADVLAQEIPVNLPRLYTTEETSNIDIVVGNLSGKDIKAFSTTITYDPEIIEILRSVSDGTLSEGFSVIDNVEEPGKITLAAASAQAIDGEGVLIKLRVHFIAFGTTNVNFSSFVFNEGDPSVDTRNGVLSNIGPVSNEHEREWPEAFRVAGNYPNPFNPVTNVVFDLPEDARVEIMVYDLLGRNVMRVAEQPFRAGRNHELQLDASELSSGVYIYQILARGRTQVHHSTGKMTLLK